MHATHSQGEPQPAERPELPIEPGKNLAHVRQHQPEADDDDDDDHNAGPVDEEGCSKDAERENDEVCFVFLGDAETRPKKLCSKVPDCTLRDDENGDGVCDDFDLDPDGNGDTDDDDDAFSDCDERAPASVSQNLRPHFFCFTGDFDVDSFQGLVPTHGGMNAAHYDGNAVCAKCRGDLVSAFRL